ncbi:signal peptidase I [Arthrobacter sp. B3I4]|uniref:signal peptidase I n=1 Tax=Arthrobacter sp. B3I4 TaxID=3042267 RepID=UPI00277D976A|nr:signal peptidase I [Arthrobacter sp. B3I4]MDQ0756026.1 signal peptidase I [Arthrobacter sp. B3I4]
MPETGPRTPDPQGHNEPRVTSSPIPAGEHPTTQLPAVPRPEGADGGSAPAHGGSAPARPVQAGRARPAPERAAGVPQDGPSHAGPTSAKARKAKAREGRSPAVVWLKEVATVVVIAVVLSFLIKTFLFRAFYIPSESMMNTLDVNDRIFVNLLVPEPIAMQRGDVVVFRDAKGWLVPTAQKPAGPFTGVQDALTFVGLLPDNSEQHLVKRVIGLPGDHVVCCDGSGRLTVNGAPLDEKYVNNVEVPQERDFDVVVPAGKVWVMGDNRNHSADSRAHMENGGGFIDVADIEGKAAVIAWPLNRITALDNYPDVFSGVPAPAKAPAGK